MSKSLSYSRAYLDFCGTVKLDLMHSDVMARVTTWPSCAMALPIVQMGVMRQTATTDKRAATGARPILATMILAGTFTMISHSRSPHQVRHLENG